MSYTHKKNSIHRDFNPNNAFLDENYYPKITVFHNSIQFEEGTEIQNSQTLSIGDPAYVAPELLEKEHYSNKIGVFSFGMFLYYILTNSEPWYEIENPTSEKIFNYIVQEKRPELQDKEIHDCFKDLIEECLSQEPKKRPSFFQIVDN